MFFRYAGIACTLEGKGTRSRSTPHPHSPIPCPTLSWENMIYDTCINDLLNEICKQKNKHVLLMHTSSQRPVGLVMVVVEVALAVDPFEKRMVDQCPILHLSQEGATEEDGGLRMGNSGVGGEGRWGVKDGIRTVWEWCPVKDK